MGGQGVRRSVQVSIARHLLQLVTLLVDEELALRTLEALPPQPPDAVLAELAEGSLWRKVAVIVAVVAGGGGVVWFAASGKVMLLVPFVCFSVSRTT